jgi:hypothetical protein
MIKKLAFGLSLTSLCYGICPASARFQEDLDRGPVIRIQVKKSRLVKSQTGSLPEENKRVQKSPLKTGSRRDVQEKAKGDVKFTLNLFKSVNRYYYTMLRPPQDVQERFKFRLRFHQVKSQAQKDLEQRWEHSVKLQAFQAISRRDVEKNIQRSSAEKKLRRDIRANAKALIKSSRRLSKAVMRYYESPEENNLVVIVKRHQPFLEKLGLLAVRPVALHKVLPETLDNQPPKTTLKKEDYASERGAQSLPSHSTEEDRKAAMALAIDLNQKAEQEKQGQSTEEDRKAAMAMAIKENQGPSIEEDRKAAVAMAIKENQGPSTMGDMKAVMALAIEANTQEKSKEKLDEAKEISDLRRSQNLSSHSALANSVRPSAQDNGRALEFIDGVAVRLRALNVDPNLMDPYVHQWLSKSAPPTGK